MEILLDIRDNKSQDERLARALSVKTLTPKVVDFIDQQVNVRYRILLANNKHLVVGLICSRIKINFLLGFLFDLNVHNDFRLEIKVLKSDPNFEAAIEAAREVKESSNEGS